VLLFLPLTVFKLGIAAKIRDSAVPPREIAHCRATTGARSRVIACAVAFSFVAGVPVPRVLPLLLFFAAAVAEL